MSYKVEVQGFVLPARFAGHLALEFCNTWAGWNGGESGDYLKSFDHLATWSGYQGLLDNRSVSALRRAARADAAGATTELDRARAFRASLYRVLTSGPTGRPWRRVAAEVERSATRSRFVAHSEASGPLAGWRLADSRELDAPLLAIAAVAGEFLTSPAVDDVRICPSEGCGWLFLDRTGRRRWCSMATCGNRAKARRFVERRASGLRPS